MTRSNHLFGGTPNSPRSGVPISPTYRQATGVNREGFPTFTRTPEEDTLSVLLCNTLSDTFYADEKELAKETVDVLEQMAKADSKFLAQAIVYARDKGLMKLAPVVGLAVLSKHNRELYYKVFQHVIRIPDDLREFVTLCRSGSIRKGINRRDMLPVKNNLRHMSAYHVVKYGSGKSEGITLRDVLRLAHPSPKDRAQEELWGWLVKGWDNVGSDPSPTNPMVWACETIKRSTDEDQIVGLIKQYRLPWEVVVPSVKKMTVNIWKALLPGMPYMALLRNLATMERHGVFADKDVVKAVSEKLSNPDNVRKSKQFPFRFFSAYNAFNGNQNVRDALVDALETSFENMEKLPGRVCIANDISGSMDSCVSDRGSTRYCDIAGLFGAAMFKKCDDVILLPFDTSVYTVKASRRATVMDLAQQIGKAMGGTDLAAPVRHLMNNGDKVDTFIGITDGEDWAGHGFLTAWEQYRKRVSPKAQAILVRIDPYRDWNSPKSDPSVHYVMGWSNAVVKYVSLIASGSGSQVGDVRKIDLDKLGGKAEEPAAVEAD